MRNPGALLLTIFTVFFAGPLAAEPSAEDLRESLRLAESEFATAFANRDLERFLSFIDDDATFLGSRENLRGKEAIRDVWSRYFEGERAPFSWMPERYDVNPSGTMGMTTGPVHDPDGKWITSFMSVWKRQPDGSWRILFDGAPKCPAP